MREAGARWPRTCCFGPSRREGGRFGRCVGCSVCCHCRVFRFAALDLEVITFCPMESGIEADYAIEELLRYC